MINILGHTVATKKEAAILLRAIIEQATRARELLDAADTSTDVVIEVPDVRVDEMVLASVDADGVRDAWAAQVARNEAELAAMAERRVEAAAAQQRQQLSNVFALKSELVGILVDMGKATIEEADAWVEANQPKEAQPEEAIK